MHVKIYEIINVNTTLGSVTKDHNFRDRSRLRRKKALQKKHLYDKKKTLFPSKKHPFHTKKDPSVRKKSTEKANKFIIPSLMKSKNIVQ